MTSSVLYLMWLIFQPSRWAQTVQRMAPALSADFCLADLDWHHSQQRPVRALLLRSLLIPVIPVMSLSLILWGVGIASNLSVIGALVGWCIGLLFAAVVNVATGLVIGFMNSLLLAVWWGVPDVHMFDMVIGTRLSFLFGLTTCLAIHVVHTLTHRTAATSLRMSAKELIISVAVSIAVFLVVLVTVLGTLIGRENYQIPGYTIGLVIALTPAVLLSLAIGWKTFSFIRGFVGGGLLFGILFALYQGLGQEFGQDIGGATLLVAIMFIAIMCYHIPFLLIFAVVMRAVGPWLGIMAASIGGLLVYPLIKQVVGYFDLLFNLSLASGWILLGMTMHWWRPMLCYPLELLWNSLLFRLDLRRSQGGATDTSYIVNHAVFWDELQWLPLWELDTHLVLAVEQNEEMGYAAMNHVSNTAQRWAAQAAQIELDARTLEQCATVQAMSTIHREHSAGLLLGPASALLRTFHKISEDIGAGLSQVGLYNQRLVLSAVENDLNGLLRELTRGDESYAVRFRPVAARWRDAVAQAVEQLDRLFEERQEILNPYVVGVPLTKHQDIFVGREDISRRIETILRNQHHPPILLYGQRRMGKTSLLYNLRWMLPHRILPVFVDLQGPAGLAENHASFLYNLIKGITISAHQQEMMIEPLPYASLESHPFTVFDDWLDMLEATMTAHDREMILLALDEFEALDAAFVRKRLDAEMILGALRHIIQHRARFKLLLAGSHTLDEFTRWSGYLINAQIVHLSYLSPRATAQLIKQPIKDFNLRYTEEAVQHAMWLTHGHPYLTQLLCSEIIMRKNGQPVELRRLATKEDVEDAAREVLIRGHQFFADIAYHQIPQDARSILSQFSATPTGESVYFPPEFPPTDKMMLRELIHRDLIERSGTGYRFQVELIRRWFAEQ